MVERKTLVAIMDELEAEGIKTATGQDCCQTCMGARLDTDSFVGWHAQDDEHGFDVEDPEDRTDEDVLKDSLYIAFGDERSALAFVTAASRHGVGVNWNGDQGRRIEVLPGVAQ